MKKNTFFKVFVTVTLLCTAFFCYGCKRDAEVKNQEIDLRNKDSNGISVARTAINNESSDIGVFYAKDEGSRSFGGLTDEELEALITFEDDENGVKVNFTSPDKFKDYWFMTRMIYLDGNENWSTRMTPDMVAINHYSSETNTFVVNSEISWVYPLVLAGGTYKFAIQFQYRKDGIDESLCPDFQLYYILTPKHGLGIIDNLPKGWDSAKYAHLDNSVFYLTNVIPIDVTGVKKSIGLWETDELKYWGSSHMVGCYDEDIDDISDATTVDLKSKDYYSEKKYVFCQFMYKYYIDGFDNCCFQTPDFLTPLTENTYFNIPVEDRD